MEQSLSNHTSLDLKTFIDIVIFHDPIITSNIDSSKLEQYKQKVLNEITYQLKPHEHNPLLISRQIIDKIKAIINNLLDAAYLKVLRGEEYSPEDKILMSIEDGIRSVKPTHTEKGRIQLQNVYKQQLLGLLDIKTGGTPGPGDQNIARYLGLFGFKKISAKTKKDGNAQIKLSKPRSSTQNNLNSTRRTRRKKTNSMAPTTSGNPQRMGRKGRRIQVDARKSRSKIQKNARKI